MDYWFLRRDVKMIKALLLSAVMLPCMVGFTATGIETADTDYVSGGQEISIAETMPESLATYCSTSEYTDGLIATEEYSDECAECTEECAEEYTEEYFEATYPEGYFVRHNIETDTDTYEPYSSSVCAVSDSVAESDDQDTSDNIFTDIDLANESEAEPDITPSFIFDGDNRTRIYDTRSYPYVCTAYLIATFSVLNQSTNP
ncbi:MAG: hypothetical protein LUD48_06560 [Prevotella sp.]|nr:hypothetical protein [Prevotella sp.]